MSGANNPVGQKLSPAFQRYVTLSYPGAPPIASPGVATITNAGRKMKIDRQEGWGTDGGRLVMTGTAIQDIQIGIRVWEDQHWIEWALFYQLLTLPILLSKIPGAPVFSLSVDHPVLKELGIRNVVLEDPGFWVPGETGDWSRTLSFVLKQTPLPRLAAPKEGPPATGVAAVPLTAQQKINAALDSENAALRAKAAG